MCNDNAVVCKQSPIWKMIRRKNIDCVSDAAKGFSMMLTSIAIRIAAAAADEREMLSCGDDRKTVTVEDDGRQPPLSLKHAVLELRKPPGSLGQPSNGAGEFQS